MRSRWEALRAGLVRSIRTPEATRQFLEMKTMSPLFTPFSEPDALIGHMHAVRGELDEKDRLLAALVTAVQQSKQAELARALLWLSLWPGLDATYRRRHKFFAEHPEELVSLLADAFTALVDRLDLSSVNRVAATLVRSTERDAMLAACRDWEEQRKRAGDVQFARFLKDKTAEDLATAARVESRLGWRPGSGITEDGTALRHWLEPIVGEDVELLVSVLVVEETQHEAGKRLGLSHDAARKRYQRALARLRAHLELPLSHLASPSRVCRAPGR